MDHSETLYEHAGGDGPIHHLEELFYEKVRADPILKQLFRERVPTHVDHLTWFTAESFGGPDRFTRGPGFQHIIDVHRHLKINDDSATGSSRCTSKPRTRPTCRAITLSERRCVPTWSSARR